MKKLTAYVDRPKSVVTGKENLEHLYTFKDFPVFFGCVETSPQDDLVADMMWGIDKETGVVQLEKLIPLETLYQEQHVDGCGPTWQQYYKDLANYIVGEKPTSVLEIGGGQGQVAELATGMKSDLTWTIVEPNPWHKGSERIKTISAFFDDNFKSNITFDAVVFSQVLEHAYDPQEFIGAIARFLKPGGKLIFAYPQLEVWLERKFTNALNFEHTMLYTDVFIDHDLIRHGFSVKDKQAYKDHSYFYVAEKLEKAQPLPTYPNKYDEYKKLFMDFVDYHETMVTDLNQKIQNASEPVYLFGAHIFSTYLLAFGLRRENIVSLLDNSPTKRSKRLYGSTLISESPQILKGKGTVNVILKAGVYNEEIKKDILENINPDVVFW